MDHILQAVEGPFTYVVIGEVSVICILFLALLYLLVRRTLQPTPGYSGTTAMPVVPANVPVDVSTNSAENDAEHVRANAGSKGSAEPTEEELLAKGYPDVQTFYAIKDKVKYLESKLLEYEILQEEIGTLSGLKMENEHLKNKLQQLEKDIEDAQTPVEATKPTAEVEVKKAPPVAPVEKTPAAAAKVEKVATEKPQSTVVEANTKAKTPASPAAPEAPPEVIAAVPENESSKDHSTEEEILQEADDHADERQARSTPPEALETEPDTKMDAGTAVETTDLEPTLAGSAQDAEAHGIEPEPTAIGQAGVEGEPAEPNDEPPSRAPRSDKSPVIENLIDQLDSIAKEKRKGRKQKKHKKKKTA